MDVIAERIFECTVDGQERAVVLRVGRPTQEPTGEWKCPYTIAGADFDVTDRIFGEDAIQALMLGLQMAAFHLYRSQAWKAGALTLYGEADLGLPLAKSFKPEKDAGA